MSSAYSEMGESTFFVFAIFSFKLFKILIRVSCSSCWLQIHSVGKDDFELLILLPTFF